MSNEEGLEHSRIQGLAAFERINNPECPNCAKRVFSSNGLYLVLYIYIYRLFARVYVDVDIDDWEVHKKTTVLAACSLVNKIGLCGRRWRLYYLIVVMLHKPTIYASSCLIQVARSLILM